MAIIGQDSGSYTPQDVERKRQWAKILLEGQQPAREPFGALAQGLRGALAGWNDYEASQAESTGRSTVAELLKNGDWQGALASEWAGPNQAALASLLQGREWDVSDRNAAWAREDARAAAAAAKPDYGFTFAPDGTLIRTNETSGEFTPMGQFGKPEAPSEPVVINGQLVNPETAAVLGDYRDAPAEPVDFGDISGIRKEVQGLPSYKNLAQALPIYNSMAETAGRDSRASDLNLVYGLGKIMDPTSVVREGEMFMVQGINTLPDKLVEGINSVLTGQSTLSPATREAIMKEAYGRMKGYEDAFMSDAGTYNDLASRYKINPQDILPEFKPSTPWQLPQQPGAPADMPKIADDAAYDALPSGATFVAPDGSVRKKP